MRNRQLIWQMTKREVTGRYRGSVLGLAWSFFHPLIMLAVYSFVFSFVFQARWNTGGGSKAEFALALFVGMIVHGLLAECINRAPGTILSNQSYVKKVVFPLEILPWITMGSVLFHLAVSLLVWTFFFLIIYHTLHWTVLFAPFIFLPLILFSMGLSWFLSAIGVYLRDIGQITGVVSTVLLFMSPVFYPASRLPEPYRTLLYLNPLTFIIEQMREVLMWGNMPDFPGLLIALCIGFLAAWLGFVAFQKTRRGFADVL
ncbi:MAG: ABC transporter permease [Thermodesulfobacteriota bacterium]|nr:ABC transporter permease [Thermodesulfobacteriota bacterium]